ncbi:MAG: nitrate reductase associated protein [Polyangiales bacterium]
MTVLPHEDAEVHRLERMPVSVERKLVETGAELVEHDWRRLPRLARQRLVDMRVDSTIERRAFRQLVAWLRETFLGAPHSDGSSDRRPSEERFEHPWRHPSPPAGVDAGVWPDLPIDLRYALFRAPTEAERARILTLFRALLRA